MAQTTINNFIGVDSLGNEISLETFFEDTQEILGARVSNGGRPDITYSSYMPNRAEGSTFYLGQFGDYLYTFNFSFYFPFASYTREYSPTPPIQNLTVSAVSTNETTANAVDGTATVSATGGTGSYEYSLNNVDWQTSNVFTGLPFGNYIAYVRDSGTGLGQASFVVEQGQYPPAPPVIPVEADITCIAGGELPRSGGFKRTIVKTVFGTTPTTLFNGDFEQYDGQNWDQWVKYGGISLSRGQRTVKDGAGNIVPIANYTLVFNQRADTGKYLEHTSIPVQSGNTGKFSVNIGKTPGTGNTTGILQVGSYSIPAKIITTYEYRMRIKVGNFYLYNPDVGNNFEWVSQLAVISRRVDNSQGDVSSYIFSFNIPAMPVTGNLVIDIFGFVKIKNTITEEYKVGFAITFPAQNQIQELPEYEPIEIDDVKLEVSSAAKDEQINGIVNISDNLDYYTNPLDQIDIIAGDLYIGDVDKNVFETLYAIYDQNGNPTTGWIDLGVNTEPIAFGLVLARSVMQSYQSSYDEFTGDLLLKKDARRFSYLDTFSFNVMLKNTNQPATDFNSKEFVLLGGSVNLKTKQLNNIKMREFFRRQANTSDISIPVNETTPLPPIVNDPNNNELIGIFTSEFTEEFN